jgi:CheY-like chemotaxis protein
MAAVVALATVAGALGGALATAGIGKLMAGDSTQASAQTSAKDSALEASVAARAEGGPFDAVILDLPVRGGMGGLETARRLRQIDPDVRAVVSSGYADDVSLAGYREQGFRAFLKKPYHVDDLRDVLSGILG